MSHTIKTVYVVHHSHTDIGYTDLQERVVQGQVNYIRSALRILDQPENENFRWNCETWFCVEEFLKTASPQETEAFFARMREGKIGFSANYLNFCDLLDTDVLSRRLDEVRALLDSHGVPMKTSITACIPCTRTRPPTGGRTPPGSGCWCGTASTTTWATSWV